MPSFRGRHEAAQQAARNQQRFSSRSATEQTVLSAGVRRPGGSCGSGSGSTTGGAGVLDGAALGWGTITTCAGGCELGASLVAGVGASLPGLRGAGARSLPSCRGADPPASPAVTGSDGWPATGAGWEASPPFAALGGVCGRDGTGRSITMLSMRSSIRSPHTKVAAANKARATAKPTALHPAASSSRRSAVFIRLPSPEAARAAR